MAEETPVGAEVQTGTEKPDTMWARAAERSREKGRLRVEAAREKAGVAKEGFVGLKNKIVATRERLGEVKKRLGEATTFALGAVTEVPSEVAEAASAKASEIKNATVDKAIDLKDRFVGKVSEVVSNTQDKVFSAAEALTVRKFQLTEGIRKTKNSLKEKAVALKTRSAKAITDRFDAFAFKTYETAGVVDGAVDWLRTEPSRQLDLADLALRAEGNRMVGELAGGIADRLSRFSVDRAAAVTRNRALGAEMRKVKP